ncbi:MAG: SDR family oxidoreductase [Acidobacteriia bacterium]|nr:SDR family oxidoreductase [Terriglobia bacterium]
MSTESLHGQTALVTGAAKRIGREIALALARAGVNVAVHFRHSARQAEELRTELASHGVMAWLVDADFSDIAAAQRLIPEVVEAAGSLEILVNSASLFLPSTIQNIDFADLMNQMQVNAWAPFVLSREFARHIGRGKIINLLDSRIVGDDRSHVAYILSKQVFALLMKMTAVEFAPRITVNGVAPGLILPPVGEDESYLNDLARKIPLKRHGEPADIADAVLYLLKSDFITGQVIFVDGGRHLMEPNRGPDHNH